MKDAFRNHWPEYFIEAWCLGTFMIFACVFGVLIFNPISPLAIFDPTLRNILMGLAMGATAVAIIVSPWGRRSGAHFNPAVTLAFLRLGRIETPDAIFYIIFHFAGGALGVLISWLILGDLLAHSAVRFVVTVPGSSGSTAAFVGEAVIAFVMMAMILFTNRLPRVSRVTPFIAGIFIAFFIAVESPVSGMSMNPARTFASAVVAGEWTAVWIYFVAPTAAMLAASEFFLRTAGLNSAASDGETRAYASDVRGLGEEKTISMCSAAKCEFQHHS